MKKFEKKIQSLILQNHGRALENCTFKFLVENLLGPRLVIILYSKKFASGAGIPQQHYCIIVFIWD